MSRIDDVLRRSTGTASEPAPPSTLERYVPEPGGRAKDEGSAPRHDEGKVSVFGTPGRRPVEARPSIETRPQVDTKPQVETKVPGAAKPVAGIAPVPPLTDSTIESEPAPEPEKLVDLRQVVDYAGFLVRALGRHKMLGAGTFVAAMAMTTVGAMLWPKTYHVQAKLLAQRNEVMTALSNPGRAVPWDADSPTHAAAETVLRRDNLISIIQQTNLIEDWEQTRAPILRVKDALTAFVFQHRPTPDERLDQLVDLLEARIIVVASQAGDGTVTIDLDWPSAQTAYRLVQAAQRTFLEARKDAEAAAIGESIGILERYSTKLHEDISRTMAELQSAQAQNRLNNPVPRVALTAPARLSIGTSVADTLPPVPAAALGSPALSADLDDPEIPRLKGAIELKRQEIANLEETRQRQLSELQARFAQLSTIYTPMHPSVVGMRQNIEGLSKEPPQLVALKAEKERLEGDYQERLAAVEELRQHELPASKPTERVAADAPPPPQPRRVRAPAPVLIEQPAKTSGDATDFASVRLRLELNQLMSVLERTDGARIELAVSQAAFKYRYTVIRPAQLPRAPSKPNLRMVFAAGFLGSLVLVLLTVLGRDLMSSRILEQWQVERQLGLPVLASLGHM